MHAAWVLSSGKNVPNRCLVVIYPVFSTTSLAIGRNVLERPTSIRWQVPEVRFLTEGLDKKSQPKELQEKLIYPGKDVR
jgi:hypothetical protein